MLDIFYSDLISERKKYFQKTCLTFQKIQKQIAVPLREKKKKKIITILCRKTFTEYVPVLRIFFCVNLHRYSPEFHSSI